MKSPKIQNAIKFHRFTVTDLNFSTLPNRLIGEKQEISFKIGIGVSPDVKSDRFFRVEIMIELRNSDGTLKIDLKSDSFFESKEIVSPEFLDSDFARVNAPAIAFPFIRSFVNTLVVNAGYAQVLLPSINFSKMYEDVKRSKARKKLKS